MPSTTQQARYWLLTIKESSWQPHLPNGVDYAKGQLEEGEGGFRHWQLIAYFKKKVRMGAVKKAFTNDTHCEPTRSDAAEEYVGKEDTRIEGTQFCFGEKSFQRNSADDWKKVKDTLASGGDNAVLDVLDKYPDIGIRYINQIEKVASLFYIPPTDLQDVCGIWIYGPPGVGKSHYVRQTYPGFFNKDMNKWWCGYKNEKTVLLDDLSLEHEYMAYFLKIWTDKYTFAAQMKGSGSRVIRPDRIVVTSNYLPENIFTKDAALLQALTRRFYFIHIPIKRF